MQHSTLGLIAGHGELPEKIIRHCLDKKRPIFVIYLDHERTIKPDIISAPHVKLNISSVGKAIKTLREQHVKDLVLAGSIKRPKLSEIRPDAGGIKLLAKISAAKLNGDNSLLTIVLRFLEESGFNILGADEILRDLLITRGVLGQIKPNASAEKDIDFGKDIAKAIGNLDIGQSVIIQHGVVIGIEAVEGTDALIKRCSSLKMDGAAPILVKMKKPHQDRRVDLPTIGIHTIENAYKAGLRGIAVEAGGALIVDRERTAAKADELGLFIVGI